MADIELIIKIPEKWFDAMVREEFEDVDELCAVIQHGTLLPEGYGRLIDVDALLTSERPRGIADDVWKESHIYKLLSTAPTIIEAAGK